MIGCDGEGSWDFYFETLRTSKRARKCSETGHVVQKGEPYVSIRGKADGEFWRYSQSVKTYHLCRALHQVWAEKHGYSECVIAFGGLCEVEEEDLHEDYGFGIAENFHPEVARCFYTHLQKTLSLNSVYAEVKAWMRPASEEDWHEVEVLSRKYSAYCIPETPVQVPENV